MTTVTARPAPAPAGTGQPGPVTRPRHRLRNGLILAAAVVLAAVAVWLVYFSSVLAAQRVVVGGVRTLTDEQVTDAAQVPLGVPLARQDVQAIAQRTASLAVVDSVTVTRDWPSAIRIQVVERKPVLLVRQPAGYLLVDRAGVAYLSQPERIANLPVVDVNPDDAALLRDLGTVAAALPSSLRRKVSSIRATSRDDIALLLESGVLVNWGDASNSSLKAEVTVALLQRHPRTSVDVSSPHNPAYR